MRRMLMLMALGMLLMGCSAKSIDCGPAVQPPATPSLPESARQGEAPSLCLPTCSKNLSTAIESWQTRLSEAE